MFKGFQNKSRQFNGFPNLNFQVNNEAYGFSGCTFWLDAAYGLNTQVNLDSISSWQPKIGVGVFAQATAANQPRLVLNDANYNNLPSIESISNVRNLLNIDGGLRLTSIFTIAVVSKVSSANTANTIIANQIGGIYNGLIDGGTGVPYTGFGLGNASSATMQLQGTTESSSTRIKIITNSNVYINGINEATGSITNYTGNFNLLFRTFQNVNNLIGSIAEILCYNYEFDTTEIVQLSDRLNSKYAIY